MIDLESFPTLPEKCRGCGIQSELGAKLFALLIIKHLAEETGESLVGEPGERFDAMVEARMPGEAADEAKQFIRKAVGSRIDDLDQHITDTQDEIAANALSCGGILRMRAVKGDVAYTAGICTSARIHIRDGAPSQIPTEVRVQSRSKLQNPAE
jgi:hypothetical protein